MDGVRERLGLEAVTGSSAVCRALLAGELSRQEIAGVELQARLVGIHAHADSAGIALRAGSQREDAGLMIQHKIVIIASGLYQRQKILIDREPDPAESAPHLKVYRNPRQSTLSAPRNHRPHDRPAENSCGSSG